jgi:hypothetical protein
VKTTITLVISVMLTPPLAHADGGAVRLHEASGPFLVTVFAAPEPLQVGPIDTSVLVQDRKTGEVVLGATVNLAFQPYGGTGPKFLSRATHGQAKNKLLQAATIDVPAPGWWSLQVSVRRGREGEVLSTKLFVMPATPRLATIWPLLILPPFAIGLFTLHHALRRSRRTGHLGDKG